MVAHWAAATASVTSCAAASVLPALAAAPVLQPLVDFSLLPPQLPAELELLTPALPCIKQPDRSISKRMQDVTQVHMHAGSPRDKHG